MFCAICYNKSVVIFFSYWLWKYIQKVKKKKKNSRKNEILSFKLRVTLKIIKLFEISIYYV